MQLDLHAVRRAFDRAAQDYDRHAVLQHEVESRLLERLEYLRQSPLCILDVGCGTGNASHQMQARYPAAHIIFPGLVCRHAEPVQAPQRCSTHAG